MAKTTTDIPQLIFNKVSKEKYEELKANGELVDNQFYITPENEVDITDKADTAYVDEQLLLKADKETTYTKEEVDELVSNVNVEVDAYTKEEVDNLIANIDIPEQTPNIKGGEYIDVIEPKGETLYEYERYMEPTGLDMGWTPYYTKTTDIEYITLPTSPELEDLVTNVANELYAFKLKKEDESKLVPVFNSNNIQLVAYDLLTDELCENLLPVLGIESTEITDEIRELSFTTVFTDVDKNSPVYATYLYNNETIMGTGNTADGIVLFVKNTHDEYGMVVHTMGKTEPFNTIELETSDKSLTIDFNEKALEMIENAGSDITTNGWNIFDHKFSDHLLNDPSWVRSDTYSWQDGGIYFTAYEELEKEFNNTETKTWYQYTDSHTGVFYASDEIPNENTIFAKLTDDNVMYPLYSSHFRFISYDESTKTISYIEPIIWSEGDENYQATYVEGADYEEITPLKDTYEDITITYYKSVNGLKICLPNQSDAIEQLYANTGVAWYYIIDTENKRFKLPRSKWNFVGLRGNVGDYVDESLPNIKGSLTRGGTGEVIHSSAIASGAFELKSTQNSKVNYTGDGDNAELYFNASRSSSTYQDNAPVQQRATEMYLYFFMGDTLRDARIIDVNAVVENQTTVTNELDALKNILATIDYVVESKLPTEEDPTWYRVYKSGWVEQGGCFTPTEDGNTEITITYPKPFKDTSYTLLGSINHSGNDTTTWDGHQGSSWKTKTTTSFTRLVYKTEYNWEAKGQGAE